MKKNKIIKYTAIPLVVVIIIVATIMFNNKSTKELTLSTIQSQETFNPFKVDTVSDANIIQQTVATLARYDKNGKVVPHAAQSITLSKDAKTVDIVLKKDLKYEDKTSIEAKDYYLGAKVFSNPKTASTYASWMLDWVKGANDYATNKSKEISGIEIVNNYELKYHLTKPLGFFKNLLVNPYFSPVNQKQIDNAGGMEKYGTNPKSFVSSGAMKYKDYKKDQYVELELNNQSPLSKGIDIKSYKVKFLKDRNTVANLYKKGQLNDIVKSDISDKILNKKTNDATTYTDDEPSMSWMVVNAKTVSKELAQAMYLALDKEYLNKTYNYSQGKVRSVLTPKGSTFDGVDNELKKQGINPNANLYDLNKAKELLKNVAKNKTLTFIVDADKIVDVKTASMYKYILNQWKSIGLNVEQKVLPSKIMTNEILQSPNTDRNYDVAINSWSPDYMETSSFTNSVLGSTSATNYSNWTNKKFDKNHEIAMSTTNQNLANKMYANNIKIAKDAAILQPIYQKSSSYYVNKNGYIVNKYGINLMINEWTQVK